ncbi:hypothetical protein FQN49_007972 [Arthroderma sp. PD_2]|nr:hypothetical protein FQN49_007972 [Arthroderma sp. PD_2]
MANIIYFITGANRGVGRGFVEHLLARPNVTMVAGVRDPDSPSSQSLQTIPTGESSKLIVVKIDSKSTTDPTAAVKKLQDQGINHLDVVIANAGISEDMSTVHTVPIAAAWEHVEVNGFGPLYLFQAVYPLLNKSEKPTFVGVGSPLGSIGDMEKVPYHFAAYGPSKAMLHWMVRKIHFENENFVSFVADPGFPQTDMGNAGARAIGMEKALHTVEEVVNGMVKDIDGATRESTGAKYRAWDGSQFLW